MSQLKVDDIVNAAGTGPANFSKGVNLTIGSAVKAAQAANFVLLNSDPHLQIVTPTANITATLPGNCKQGEVFEIYNAATAFVITIKADDASNICVASEQYSTRVMALIDNAGISTDWLVLGGTATENGKKKYLINTAYLNGTPAVSASNNISSITTVNVGALIPYKTTNGTWNLRFNISLIVVSVSALYHAVIISGASATLQSFSAFITGDYGTSGLYNGTQLQLVHTPDAITPTTWVVSGDVGMVAKPTWAD